MKQKKIETIPGQSNTPRPPVRNKKRMTEYGRQSYEKQIVKRAYGVRERQFKRFFDWAQRSEGAPGEALLCLLERRLDNVVYRLKLAATRAQARQMIVHGHVIANGKKVYSPSFIISVNDEIGLAPKAEEKSGFIETVVNKRLKSHAKVPEWLELDKKNHVGRVVRLPVRDDIQLQVNENSIVELYSK